MLQFFTSYEFEFRINEEGKFKRLKTIDEKYQWYANWFYEVIHNSLLKDDWISQDNSISVEYPKKVYDFLEQLTGKSFTDENNSFVNFSELQKNKYLTAQQKQKWDDHFTTIIKNILVDLNQQYWILDFTKEPTWSQPGKSYLDEQIVDSTFCPNISNSFQWWKPDRLISNLSKKLLKLILQINPLNFDRFYDYKRYVIKFIEDYYVNKTNWSWQDLEDIFVFKYQSETIRLRDYELIKVMKIYKYYENHRLPLWQVLKKEGVDLRDKKDLLFQTLINENIIKKLIIKIYKDNIDIILSGLFYETSERLPYTRDRSGKNYIYDFIECVFDILNLSEESRIGIVGGWKETKESEK